MIFQIDDRIRYRNYTGRWWTGSIVGSGFRQDHYMVVFDHITMATFEVNVRYLVAETWMIEEVPF